MFKDSYAANTYSILMCSFLHHPIHCPSSLSVVMALKALLVPPPHRSELLFCRGKPRLWDQHEHHEWRVRS